MPDNQTEIELLRAINNHLQAMANKDDEPESIVLQAIVAVLLGGPAALAVFDVVMGGYKVAACSVVVSLWVIAVAVCRGGRDSAIGQATKLQKSRYKR
jgi:uncharacterized membrane protein